MFYQVFVESFLSVTFVSKVLSPSQKHHSIQGYEKFAFFFVIFLLHIFSIHDQLDHFYTKLFGCHVNEERKEYLNLIKDTRTPHLLLVLKNSKHLIQIKRYIKSLKACLNFSLKQLEEQFIKSFKVD